MLNIFRGADNLNPLFSNDGKTIYFLSNRDGLRNLYEYNLESGETWQLTRFATGISGITTLSPAISILRNDGKIAYTLFRNSNYTVFSAGLEEFSRNAFDQADLDFTAAVLPPMYRGPSGIVDRMIAENLEAPVFPADSFRTVPYRPQFRLDHIGNSGVGITASNYGVGASGGVFMLFGDMLGKNQLFSMVALNGEIYDFGVQVGYLNQSRRAIVLPSILKKLLRESDFRFLAQGASLRINLFGAMILEPYYAFPFIDRGIKGGVWGLNFVPGW